LLNSSRAREVSESAIFRLTANRRSASFAHAWEHEDGQQSHTFNARARAVDLHPAGATKPYNYQYEPPAGIERRRGDYVERIVDIADGRPLRGAFSLDVQGFELLHSPTLANDLYDEAELQKLYRPEIGNLVRSVTGADKVLVFDHTIRSNAEAHRGKDGVREAVRRVHNDYTDKSAPQRIRDLLRPTRPRGG